VILALAALLQISSADSIPRITLTDALERAARLDPNYVQAVGGVDNAEWSRRAALTAFLIPTVNLSTTADWDERLSPTFAGATLAARLDLFTGGQKIAEMRRSRAELESAEAGEVRSRFVSAFLTESDYYAALSDEELSRVSAERVRRAEEQLGTARARVQSGAAVQTDSLQLQLELTRARVGLLRQNAQLRTSRLQLGRRVGITGPVQPVPLDTARAPDLPFTQQDAVQRALAQGPEYRIARADEREAQAELAFQRGRYLPSLTAFYTLSAFDDRWFPNTTARSSISLTLQFPLWDGARREIAISQARVRRDVARAIRADVELAGQRDVGFAYEAYETARAETDLTRDALVVARENFRVQDARYRSGATTILDIVEAQLALADAEANLVTARYRARLAQAALEVILGERFSNRQGAP
jgi:outer membrane protein